MLITAQRGDFLGQFWDDLRTGETGSDDRRPTPVPGNNRDAWLGQETGRSNHELSGKRLTVGQRVACVEPARSHNLQTVPHRFIVPAGSQPITPEPTCGSYTVISVASLALPETSLPVDLVYLPAPIISVAMPSSVSQNRLRRAKIP